MTIIGFIIIIAIFIIICSNCIQLQQENEELREKIINIELELAKYDKDMINNLFEDIE